MSFQAERASIEGRLSDNWVTTPIAYDNVSFDAPDNSAWVRLGIINGASKYRALEGKKRHAGVIIIQLFAPKNQGSNLLRGYADTIAAIFEGVNFDTVTCRNASLLNVGISQEWYQMNLSIPYWRDEP